MISSTDPESGGPVEALLRYSEVLQRRGHEVVAASLESPEEAAKRAFPFPIVGLGYGVGKYRYNRQMVKWLRQQANSFDVVVLHGLWNFSSLGSWLGLRGQSVPYYIFAHGMMDPWFREKYPIKHFCKQAYWWLGEGRVLRDAKYVFFTCEEERLRAENVFSGYRFSSRVVRLGTADPHGDAESEKRAFFAACPALKDRRFLLYLSRIHPKKGCDLLVKAFAAEIASMPADLDIVMAGPDQLGWVSELQSLVSRLGIAQRVHWPGMLKGQCKWGAFRSAQALVLPSHQENFGFVVAEAMACSTPVLISNKVNIWREVIESGAGIVEPDTTDGVRNLIRRFCALSHDERTVMARAAREGFLEYFDIEAAASDFARAIGFQSDKEHHPPPLAQV
jgi:glycosyltransferase involved in cell wall biosynthesis